MEKETKVFPLVITGTLPHGQSTEDEIFVPQPVVPVYATQPIFDEPNIPPVVPIVVKKFNPFALLGFLFSLVSVAFPVFFPFALAFSIIGAVKAKKLQTGKSLAVAGICFTTISLTFWIMYIAFNLINVLFISGQ